MAIVDVSLREAWLVQVLEALADPSRILIISELSRGPIPVNELVSRVSLAQATVSGHLAVLRRSGLVSVEVKRNQRIYSLTGTTALHMIAVVRRFIAANERTPLGGHPCADGIEQTY